MSDAPRLTHITTLCGECSCGCPELFLDSEALPDRRVVITDDFGQRVRMSLDQFLVLVDQARSGVFDDLADRAAAL